MMESSFPGNATDVPVSLHTLYLADESATLSLGEQLSACLCSGTVVFFHGELGAGKTTLVRGILRGLGHRGKVRSPTYNLVEIYEIAGVPLYHFDFYRFSDPLEWEEAGFREYFNPHSICLIEWPEKAKEFLHVADLDIQINYSKTGRTVAIKAETEIGKQCLSQWLNKKYC